MSLSFRFIYIQTLLLASYLDYSVNWNTLNVWQQMCKCQCHLFVCFYWNHIWVWEHDYTVNLSYNHLSPAASTSGLTVFFIILDTSDALHYATGRAKECETGGKNQYNEAWHCTKKKWKINQHLCYFFLGKTIGHTLQFCAAAFKNHNLSLACLSWHTSNKTVTFKLITSQNFIS